ncbi:MAG: cache domain-containing protein [Polyangiaceae bacterium]|nr:cache domain-containing protein [Polyangiaceae bacterium]
MALCTNLKIKTRLVLLGGGPIIALILVAAWLLNTYRDGLMQAKQDKTRSLIDAAYGVIELQYQLVSANKISEKEGKARALAALAKLRYGDNDYFWVNDLQAKMIMHPVKPELNGKDMSDFKDPNGVRPILEAANVAREKGSGFVHYSWPKPGHAGAVPKISYVRAFEPWGWALGTGIYVDDVEEEFVHEIGHASSVIVPIFLLVALLGFVMSRSISTPLKQVETAIDRASQGDLTARVALGSTDELGVMSDRIDRMLAEFERSMAHVQRSAESTRLYAQRLAAVADEVSAATQEQAASLEETAASIEQISGAVDQNAKNARGADELSGAAHRQAAEGGRIVEQAMEAMHGVTTSSHRIEDVASTIDEFAFQTNLLALNAAVEAARAGEAGRGFAVVAAEVRALAQRSASASREVRELIAQSVRSVESGSSLVTASGERLGDVVRDITSLARLVSDIARASSEQSTGVQQVSIAISQTDQATQQTAAQTEELSETAGRLAAQAASLESLVSKFTLGDALDVEDDELEDEPVHSVPPPPAPRARPAPAPAWM